MSRLNRVVVRGLVGLSMALVMVGQLAAQDAAKPPADGQPPATNPAKAVPPKTDPPPQTPPAPTPGDTLIPTQPGFLMHVAVNRADARYSHGEQMSVKFKSERDAHVYLLYHQTDGSVVMIFPNKAQPSNQVKAKEEISIPKQGDNFRFRVTAPYGEEAMQVIASAKPVEALDKLDYAAGRAVAVPKLALEELAATIKKSPGEFAETRVVVHTQKGGGPLPEARPPKRVGLFIGVNKLKDDEFGKSTEQAKGSAIVMHEAMTTLGGIALADTRLITDEQATTAAFEESMTKWLPSITQSGDTVFLFYCGHGGQIPAIDDSEPDGLDEILTMYDYDREHKRETGVVDDRLARWLQELPGRQIVMLMDTCHGGGLVDGIGTSTLLRDEVNRVHDISQLNTLVVCACLPDEFSHFSLKYKCSFMPILLREAMEKLPQPVSVQAAYQYYHDNLPRMIRANTAAPPTVQETVLTDHILIPVVLAPVKK